MTSSILWDITPCSPLKVNGRFEGPYHLHLHGRRIRLARNHSEAGIKQIIPEDRTLNNYGLSPRWLNWFRSYLRDIHTYIFVHPSPLVVPDDVPYCGHCFLISLLMTSVTSSIIETVFSLLMTLKVYRAIKSPNKRLLYSRILIAFVTAVRLNLGNLILLK
jgi:hypothetical protein